jgi:phosphoglycerate dehydrogenase-like enzyme
VAEASLGLLLAVFRQLPTYHQVTLGGAGWTIPAEAGERCREVAGAKVGLVGYGDIAQRFGSILTAMGAEVRHHSTRTDRPGWMPLLELAANSDVLSIHVPFTPATERLVNAEVLTALPPRAVVLNTSRGGVLDNGALARELNSGHLGGAGLDVFDEEPWVGPDPLRGAPNVVCTPHVAWLTWETLERSLEIATENVARVRNAEALRYQVG